MTVRRGPDVCRLALLLLACGAALAAGALAVPRMSRASAGDGAASPPPVFPDVADVLRLEEPWPTAPPEVVGTWILEDPLPPRHGGDGAANPIRFAIGAQGSVHTRVRNSMSCRVDPRSLAEGRFVQTELARISLVIPSPPWDQIERQLFAVPRGGTVVFATEQELVLSSPAGATLRFRRDQGDEPVSPH